MLALHRSMRSAAAPAVASRSSAFMASPVAPVRVALVAVKASPTTVTVECKLKTRKSASKRFKVTGTGKLMARHSGKQHMNEKMDRDTKRNLSQMFVLHSGDVYNATKCMPYAGIGKK